MLISVASKGWSVVGSGHDETWTIQGWVREEAKGRVCR